LINLIIDCYNNRTIDSNYFYGHYITAAWRGSHKETHTSVEIQLFFSHLLDVRGSA